MQHHRVTLDDDSAYHMKAKIKKGELDRLYGKIIEIEHELEINGGVISREEEIIMQLEAKIDEMNKELDALDNVGGYNSSYTTARDYHHASSAKLVLEEKCKNALKDL